MCPVHWQPPRTEGLPDRNDRLEFNGWDFEGREGTTQFEQQVRFASFMRKRSGGVFSVNIQWLKESLRVRFPSNGEQWPKADLNVDLEKAVDL